MHALITGASSGIGEALAHACAAKGWSLTLAARRQERLEALAQSLDTKTFVRPADLSDLDQCAALYRDAVQALGPVDVLINNAGIQYVEPTLDIDDQRAETLMAVDYFAPMRLMRLAARDMLTRTTPGHVVNIASLAAINPTPGMCHYNAAKAALAAASESLRVELQDSPVHILTVYPGPVSSDMESAARASFEPSKAVENLPTGTPQELAQQILAATARTQARLIYPAFYKTSYWFRNVSQWATNAFAPKIKK